MVFSSPIFLFLFLPLVLGVCFAVPPRIRNMWLLIASLVFYAWGEPRFALIMMGSIVANFGFGLWLDRVRERPQGRGVLMLAVAVNLALLGVYKYASFFVENLNGLLPALHVSPIALAPVALPLGISFYTFHALSYLVDVYRRTGPVQRNAPTIGLYIAFFPQLIAGPIIRYHYIAEQLVRRTVTREGFAHAVERFVIGMGKKMLVANSVAVPADAIFAIPADQLTAGLAWLGIVCYTLQIYFDFSGYSDMAIGLALMFGFRFPENFNYPYISRSMTEFWRRWHISLSTWFRDYVYVPLGGNRVSPGRTYVNLVVTFFLCGLWHGAAWTFVVWGLYHGLFLVIERLGAGRWLDRCPAALRHAYALLVTVVGWVLFRSATLGDAGRFLTAMSGLGTGSGLEYHTGLYLNPELVLILAAGIVGSTPVLPALARWRARLESTGPGIAVEAARLLGLGAILWGSALLMAAGTYNPFIYFRF